MNSNTFREQEEKKICPIVETIKIIGTEPRLLVLRYLFDGPKGFNELLRETKLSSKTLSSTLKFLENTGIIERKIASTRPFRVEYVLTDKGKELENLFKIMKDWGEKWVLRSAEFQKK
ncbi:transcriptional regulator [Sulfolobus sp. A20]|uniref:winged helix-turn-helix transcriptional regulator n=1 Tax=Sulfolobaceae TaxID=118883 RepID=UPI000845BEBF|nr:MULTISPECIES: helix-turn-helix domain-containing protein [unclassified Sulfolobus]TRM78568.1 transcriptional regulator [Sulfolobus sp. A20-N-F8]TRM79895.1 transcriptional regulator [Sulfolobus sp. D5]TRM83170.1 transcriptional regulator [Sulfolobus sp. A20-N-F6]TRM83417.1 transcriptional regulator [Sulfolobus sp. F3]TRM87567.1 transcriptional regulator [Sulfolobus sp. C3]TRM99372.1 transcriptional regulator [Sulfolobus sp. E1]TRN03942.1 transcriptional regulator [Sulfolobus sp. F1]